MLGLAIRAVGHAAAPEVVEHGEDVELPGLLEGQRAQDLVGAGRVLDQQDRRLDAVADGDRLGAVDATLRL